MSFDYSENRNREQEQRKVKRASPIVTNLILLGNKRSNKPHRIRIGADESLPNI